jgi:hemerythrin
MPTISWDVSMSTGVDTLDNQHKQLIAWLNDLLDAISLGRSGAEVARLIDRLSGYTVMHFGGEEACMEHYRCPVAARNAAAHREFVLTLAAFKGEYEATGVTAQLAVRVQTELMRWLTGHIKRIDAQLGHCVTDTGF